MFCRVCWVFDRALTAGDSVLAKEDASHERERDGAAMATAGGSMLASRVIAQGTQLVLFLVAARVLAPADFGVFAIVVAVSMLLTILGAAGWSEFVLGRSGDETATNQAIAYAVVSGYILATIGLASAAVALFLFEEPFFSILILTFAAMLFLAPITRTYGAILVRRKKVLAFSSVMIVSDLIGLAVGIAGLMAGWNIVALGVAKFVTQVATFAGLLVTVRRPVQLNLRGGYGSEIFEVSRSILTSRVIGFFSSNSSTFIIGMSLGLASVGYYRAAERVVNAISEMLFEPMRLISWVMFRQAADGANSPADVREMLAQEGRYVFPLLILCAAPIFIGLAIISDDIVRVFLGETWLPAAPVVTVLALAALLFTPSIADAPLLTISGKINVLPPVMLFNAVVTIITFLVFTQFGLMAAAFARLVSGAIAFVTSMWMQGKHAGAPWWAAVKTSAPVYAGVIGLIVAVVFANRWLVEQDFGLISRVSLEVFIGAIAYFIIILMVRPSFLRNTFSLT